MLGLDFCPFLARTLEIMQGSSKTFLLGRLANQVLENL